jgi:hydroxyethylthiazole kinase-like uncharacterized protein yjeF
MLRVTPDRPWPLHDVLASRAVESAAAATLPPHALMQRAGHAVARLALAIAPHARRIWIACGPGNNGGDGFEAAMQLKQRGKDAVVTFAGDESKLPADAAASFRRARAAGVPLQDKAAGPFDLAIDAMLGIGTTRPLEGPLRAWASAMRGQSVLAVDIPSGLSADTGNGESVRATHTLSLLTLKPGLFTAHGRDACGQVWFDNLGVDGAAEPTAWLSGPPLRAPRPHDSHKGTWGDVAVIGGAPGLAGAALLAASGALHGGAGRVYVGLLGDALPVDLAQPELMMRDWTSLDLAAMTVACGCGGGDAVRAALPKVISTARELVLDADALNAVANDPQLGSQLETRGRRGRPTVLTPHPMEAARLLSSTTQGVQSDRLRAAQSLAQRFGCAVLLKGSGSIVAAPARAPHINPTGNAKLATAGTGDVLAGLVAARLAAGAGAFDAAAGAAYEHGASADAWGDESPLTAAALARKP